MGTGTIQSEPEGRIDSVLIDSGCLEMDGMYKSIPWICAHTFHKIYKLNNQKYQAQNNQVILSSNMVNEVRSKVEMIS